MKTLKITPKEILKLGDKYGKFWKKQAHLGKRMIEQMSISWARGYMSCLHDLEILKSKKEMKTPKKVEWYFVVWLQNFCEIVVKDDDFKWKVQTETHIYELMSTKEAYKFWKKHIKK